MAEQDRFEALAREGADAAEVARVAAAIRGGETGAVRDCLNSCEPPRRGTPVILEMPSSLQWPPPNPSAQWSLRPANP